MHSYPCYSSLVTPVGQSVSPTFANCFPVKQLKNDHTMKQKAMLSVGWIYSGGQDLAYLFSERSESCSGPYCIAVFGEDT